MISYEATTTVHPIRLIDKRGRQTRWRRKDIVHISVTVFRVVKVRGKVKSKYAIYHVFTTDCP